MPAFATLTVVAALAAPVFGLVSFPRDAPAIQAVPESQWKTLNSSVGGRLVAVRPPAAPCYARFEGGLNNKIDLKACAEVESKKNNPTWIASQPGGYQEANWGFCQAKGTSCPLDSTLPIDPITPLAKDCSQGSTPPMAIAVESVSDVQKGLAFVQQHKIPIVIKNSGHDYKGRSSAPNSLSLFMTNLRPAMSYQPGFIPDSCNDDAADAITFGSGYGFAEVLEFAHSHGKMIVSGSSGTVRPAGGWIAGGGHSPLTPVYGLGVDNVLQFKVVKADGTLVTANRCQNQDLFFALRGGGGGTFGVVTEMSSRALDEVPLQVATYAIGSLNATAYKAFTKILVENAAKWNDEGFGGYVFPHVLTSGLQLLLLATPRLTRDQAVASMKPVDDFANDLLGGNVNVLPGIVNGVKTSSSYYDLFSGTFGNAYDMSGNGAMAVSSRIVPAANFAPEKQDELVDALASIATSGPIFEPLYMLFVAPNTGHTGIGAGNDTSSVTPAWRGGLVHVALPYAFSNEADAAVIKNAFSSATRAMDALRKITPGSGAYQNEADTYEPDHTNSFWGAANYEKLLKVKQDVDPGNVFSCHQCVGARDDDPRLSCYPSL